VLPIVHRTTYAILSLLLVCMTATVVIACQVHTTLAAPEQAIPGAPHHSPQASGYTVRAMPCVLAVLPSGVLLMVCTYTWFQVARRLLHGTIPAFS